MIALAEDGRDNFKARIRLPDRVRSQFASGPTAVVLETSMRRSRSRIRILATAFLILSAAVYLRRSPTFLPPSADKVGANIWYGIFPDHTQMRKSA